MRCTMAAQGGMGAARHPAALHPGISRIFYGSDRDFLPPPQIPLLTTWKGQLCARLNVTSEAALGWYLARARRLRQALGATYVAFEGVEGNSFLEQDVPAPAELAGDGYTEVLAAALATLGNGTVISAGTRWAPGRADHQLELMGTRAAGGWLSWCLEHVLGIPRCFLAPREAVRKWARAVRWSQ